MISEEVKGKTEKKKSNKTVYKHLYWPSFKRELKMFMKYHRSVCSEAV